MKGISDGDDHGGYREKIIKISLCKKRYTPGLDRKHIKILNVLLDLGHT